MRVAIIGCGQLARMMALAARRMGIRVSFVCCDGESSECVDGLGPVIAWSDHTPDAAELFAALEKPDVITIERENVNLQLLQALRDYCAVHPSPQAVSHCQHRLRERRLLQSLGIATVPFAEAFTQQQLEEAVSTLGLPVVVKDARSGYDGKHQAVIRSPADLAAFQHEHTSGEWLVEKWIKFDREISIIAARSPRGEVALYPATQNLHEHGVLRQSLAPAENLTAEQQETTTACIEKLLEGMDYVGVLTVEFFVAGNQLLVNELAPRVHNSGHWTQQADVTSQFENHLRAVLNLPLGSTRLNGYAGFINILGVRPGPACYAALSGSTALHWYDKQPRPGRKLGHVGVSGLLKTDVVKQLEQLQDALYGQESLSADHPP